MDSMHARLVGRWMTRGAAAAVVALAAAAATAEPVTLKAALGAPKMLADQKQTAYVRVSLTGAAPDADSTTKRATANIAIVLDRSGSMQGAKIESAKKAALLALEMCSPEDIVSVLSYDDTVQVLVPATKLGTERSSIMAAINRIQPGGGTGLFAGVSKGADELRKFLDRGKLNRVVLLSDGLANIGPSSPSDLAQLGVGLGKEGISVSTIGLGLGYSEDLMTQLASKSGGSHYFSENDRDLAGAFEKEFKCATSVVAQEAAVKLECAEGVRPVRVLGREAEIAGRTVRVPLGQVYAGSEKYAVIEVELPAGKVGDVLKVAEARIEYVNPSSKSKTESSATVEGRFVASKAEADASEDKDAMVAVVEQLATERSQTAMKLRDEGKVAEARQTLLSNSAYLGENATKYKSSKLAEYKRENTQNADGLDEEKWGRTRKAQSQGDVYRVKQ